MPKNLSLQNASDFFKNESNLSDYYFKSSKNGIITVQKKTFFRKVCRWLGITFGYDRSALTATVIKVVNYLNEKNISLPDSLSTFIANKKITVLDKNYSSISNSIKPPQRKLSPEEIAENKELLSAFNARCKTLEGYKEILKEKRSKLLELEIENNKISGRFSESRSEELKDFHKKMEFFDLNRITDTLMHFKDPTIDPSKKIENKGFKSDLEDLSKQLSQCQSMATWGVENLQENIIIQENSKRFHEVANVREKILDCWNEIKEEIILKFKQCKDLNKKCVKLNADLLEKLNAEDYPSSDVFRKTELELKLTKLEKDREVTYQLSKKKLKECFDLKRKSADYLEWRDNLSIEIPRFKTDLISLEKGFSKIVDDFSNLQTELNKLSIS